jgi:hypothetical protein
MAHALVVYESVFGNAREIAHAIAEGLAPALASTVVAAGEAPKVIGPDVELLVVGGPNHALGMPRPSTRQGAVDGHGAVIEDTTVGLHEWLETVEGPRDGLGAAAFDTRSSRPALLVKLDHASRTEEKLLRRLEATLVAPAAHFTVTDTKGPLSDGERDRAREWGRRLGELAAARSSR